MPRIIPIFIAVLLLAACDDKTVTPTLLGEPDGFEEIPADPYPGSWTKQVFAHQIIDEKDLIVGDAAQGRIGDWIIRNDVAKFIIQGPDRHSGPCSYGGNVIDVSYKGGPDVIGELCLFLDCKKEKWMINLGFCCLPQPCVR